MAVQNSLEYPTFFPARFQIRFEGEAKARLAAIERREAAEDDRDGVGLNFGGTREGVRSGNAERIEYLFEYGR